ncbi:MAG: glycosyltransferase family 4 protein [Armatimonadaceae bacterium]
MSTEKPKILFLAHLLPYPLHGGGQIKTFHTLRLLSERYDILLIAFIRHETEREHVPALEPLCACGVRTVLLHRSRWRDLQALSVSLVQRRSLIIQRDDSSVMRELVAQQLEKGVFRAVHVDHLQMMPFVPPETPGVSVVLDNHNVEYRLIERIAQTPEEHPLIRALAAHEFPLLREVERAAVRRADMTLAVSEEDAGALRELAASCADRVEVAPIGVDTEYFAPVTRIPESRRLLFVGTLYWHPNVDALRFFAREILPLIQAQVSGVTLSVVGAKPTGAVRALQNSHPAITVAANVDDIRPCAEGGAVFVVPLRSGSGMRVKILNALAMGLPVVSTTLGAEGIGVTSGEDILLADTPEDFAAAVITLLREPERAKAIGANGRRLVERQYRWEAVGKALLRVYEERIFGKDAEGR